MKNFTTIDEIHNVEAAQAYKTRFAETYSNELPHAEWAKHSNGKFAKAFQVW